MEITREQKELAAAQRQEFDDLQNEIAGRETGRRARFLKDGPGSETAKEKERDARRALKRLAELLNDPVYRAKYDGVMTALQDAERAIETALERITREIDAVGDDIANMQDRAARLPDGTRVYRDVDGNLHREDGSEVDDVLAATIVWSGNEPSYEDYRRARDRLDALLKEKTQAEIYRDDVLGPARDKITDPENPPSLGELDGILDNIQSAMPDGVKSHMADAPAPPQPETDPFSIAIPTLGTKP